MLLGGSSDFSMDLDFPSTLFIFRKEITFRDACFATGELLRSLRDRLYILRKYYVRKLLSEGAQAYY